MCILCYIYNISTHAAIKHIHQNNTNRHLYIKQITLFRVYSMQIYLVAFTTAYISSYSKKSQSFKVLLNSLIPISISSVVNSSNTV